MESALKNSDGLFISPRILTNPSNDRNVFPSVDAIPSFTITYEDKLDGLMDCAFRHTLIAWVWASSRLETWEWLSTFKDLMVKRADGGEALLLGPLMNNLGRAGK